MNEVSIVIPSYNYGRYLPQAIESALDQTVKCEVIVVDDGSTDNSAEIALRYPVHFIKCPTNRGLPAARNTGIAFASGKYILPLDADDLIKPQTVEKMLEVDHSGIVRVGLEYFGDRELQLPPMNESSLEEFLESNRVYVTSLFPKQAWEKVGGFDESLTQGLEDWDFWVRLLHAGYPVHNVPEGFWFRYRFHGTSMTSAIVNPNFNKTAEYLRDKWHRMGIT